MTVAVKEDDENKEKKQQAEIEQLRRQICTIVKLICYVCIGWVLTSMMTRVMRKLVADGLARLRILDQMYLLFDCLSWIWIFQLFVIIDVICTRSFVK